MILEAGMPAQNVPEEINIMVIRAVFLILLGVISRDDIRYKTIPVILLILSVGLGIINIIVQGEYRPIDVVGQLFPGLFVYIIAVSKGGIARGDACLLMASGMILGAFYNLIFCMITFFTGGIVGLIIMIAKRDRKLELPFVPLMLVGMIIEELIRA